jgi:hypothetical protein
LVSADLFTFLKGLDPTRLIQPVNASDPINAKKRVFYGFIRVARAVIILCCAAATTRAWCATYVVTNTGDTGDGSLRQAILSANLSTNVPDDIRFTIPGTGPHSISPTTPLPALTDPVVIDGYSQPAASPNTLSNGDNAVLQIVLRESLVIDTTNSTVRGLAIRQIQVGATPGPKGSNVIEGCFVGLDATGTNSLASPGFGVFVQTPNNRVGGPNAAARNIISGHGAVGIELFETFATNNVVQGNFIGTDRTGTQAIGNTDRAVAVNMNASANIIGGEVAGAGNVISGNLDRGITLDGSGNLVQGNFIGVTVTGQPLGNARTGVEIGGSRNTVGSARSGGGNVIAYNGLDGRGFFTTNGVDVKQGATFYGILGNSIFDNMGLGIDVNADGQITPGFPVLTLVSNTSTATLIQGTYMPNVGFVLQLFTNPTPDPSGYGEGKALLIRTNAATDGAGNFSINWPPLPPGLFVTAIADDKTEFSQARMVTVAGGDNSWTNNGSGKWESGANWSLNVPPFLSHTVISITNAGTKTVNNDAATATGFPTTLTISNLVISAPAGATNTLRMAHGGTSTPLRILTSLNINSGGALAINDAALRFEGSVNNPFAIDGSLTLDGGLLTVTNTSVRLVVGNNGPGTLNVSNGTLMAYYPIVGANAGANGTWHIAGGTNIATTTFDIADSLTATGTVKMTGGHLSVPSAYIGLFGNGQLIVSNGIFECASQGLVASQPGAQGTFIAAGGLSIFDSMLIGESSTATGAVLVTGSALVQVNGQFDNRGKVTVAGGLLNVLGHVESTDPGNELSVTGGQFVATNETSFLTRVTVSNGTFLARDVFLGNGQLGTLTVDGNSTVSLPGSFNGFTVGANGGTGIVSQAGGQILLTDTDLNIGGLFTPAVGQMTVSNGRTQARHVLVGGQGGGNGTMRIEGGTLSASNLEVNATSQLIFNRGILQTVSSTVANDAPLVVGDGSSTALYQLLGGTNSFPKGLRIASNAQLAGTGTIIGSVTNSGVIAPGTSAGRLDITGSLVLSNSSELRLELGGYAPSQFDFISVSGGARLGGTLAVSLSNNFQSVMTNGATFTVLTAGNPVSGAFANVSSGGVLTTTDGYARFTVVYAGATTLQLTGLVIVDTDGDGLPDWWEDQFGLSKTNAADALLDLDSDGASNANEFRAGTRPNDPNSVFRIVAFQREGSNVRVTWATVGGKSYRVQTNSLLNNFTDVSSSISVSGIGESTTNYLDNVGFTNVPARYYRIRLEP